MKVSVCARGWKIARGAMVGVGRGRDARGIVSCRASGHFGTDGGRRPRTCEHALALGFDAREKRGDELAARLESLGGDGRGRGGRAEPSVDGSVSNHADGVQRHGRILRRGFGERAGTGQRPAGGNGDGSENTGGGDEYLEERVHRADAGVRAEAEGRASPSGSGCPSLFELRTSGSDGLKITKVKINTDGVRAMIHR